MTKRFTTNAVMGIAILCCSAVCAAQPYVGANLGRADMDARVRLGLAPGADAVASDTDNGYKLVGGYQLSRHLGVEAGYVVHGELKVPLSGRIATLEPRSLYVAATGTLPLNQQFSLFGKLGVANNRVAGESKAGALLGAGVSYVFTPAVSAVLEYEHFRKMNDQYALKSKLVSAGVRVAF